MIFTARYYAERDYAKVCRPSLRQICLSLVCPSIGDVQVCFFLSNRLEYFENCFTADYLRYQTWNDPKMDDLVQRDYPQDLVWNGSRVVSTKTCNISETVQDGTKVTMTD